MGFVVPDWKESIKQNVYPITIGKKIYNLPKAKYLTGAQAERMEDAEDAEGGIYGIFDEFCAGLGSALREIPVGIFEEILDDWQKESGVTVGESPASAS